MRKSRTGALVAELAAGVDLERVLRDLKLTPRLAMIMLRGGFGKRQIAERRALAKIHARLVASRFSMFAVHRLCELLQSEKPELRLKGAISVLNISGLAKVEGSAKRRAKEKAGMHVDENLTAAERELLETLGAMLVQRREGKN